jgi:hypothetical protein
MNVIRNINATQAKDIRELFRFHVILHNPR